MKIIRSRRGEGYIDICIGVIAFVMMMVVAINLFRFVTLKVEMDRIAEELLESAARNGSFSDDFDSLTEEYKSETFDFTVETGADAYYNTALKRVQLGERMWITVTYETEVYGVGAFSIPVTLSVTKSALSQKYWKQVTP